ncbi:MAG: hypothetical protein ACJAY8_001548 [Sphingobacteriales bacterium]|jgi:hypothetical protein
MFRFLFGLLILAVCSSAANAQITAPTPDKAVVYFVRYNPSGFLIGFSYYDGREFIGKFADTHYFRYECEPGPHLFWAKAENRSFIEADLLPGKIYVVEVRPLMGIVAARVRLLPLSGKESFWKRITLIVANKKCTTIVADEELAQVKELRQKRALEGQLKYQKLKDKGKEIKYLAPEMHVSIADFEYVSRKDRKKLKKEQEHREEETKNRTKD